MVSSGKELRYEAGGKRFDKSISKRKNTNFPMSAASRNLLTKVTESHKRKLSFRVTAEIKR